MNELTLEERVARLEAQVADLERRVTAAEKILRECGFGTPPSLGVSVAEQVTTQDKMQ